MKKFGKNGLFFLMVAALCTSCDLTKKTTDEASQEGHAVYNEKANPACNADLVVAVAEEFSNSNLYIESLTYEAPCLVLRYQYSGCKKAQAQLVWSGKLTRSYPPTAFLELFLDEVGDCDQLHEDTLRVDLGQLRKIAGKKFVVQVNHFKNSTTVSVID